MPRKKAGELPAESRASGGIGSVIDFRQYETSRDDRGKKREPVPYDPGPMTSREAVDFREDATVYTFLATKKRLSVVLDDGRVVMFEGSTFRTTDETLAEKLRQHEAFGQFYFEEEYPEWYIEYLKEQQKYITYDPEAYG